MTEKVYQNLTTGSRLKLGQFQDGRPGPENQKGGRNLLIFGVEQYFWYLISGFKGQGIHWCQWIYDFVHQIRNSNMAANTPK